MKTVCGDCGAAMFHDGGPDLAAKLMAEHLRMNHAPAVEKQLLAEAREQLAIANTVAAAELHNRISELLGLPAIDLTGLISEEKVSKKAKEK